jgi:hypothetical protein
MQFAPSSFGAICHGVEKYKFSARLVGVDPKGSDVKIVVMRGSDVELVFEMGQFCQKILRTDSTNYHENSS